MAIFGTVTLFCIIAAPFGTQAMSPLARAVYWVAANSIALVMSTTIIFAAYEFPLLTRLPAFLRGVVGALAFSLLFSALMATVSALAAPEGDFPGFALMFAYVAPIAIAITLIVHLFIRSAERESDIGDDPAPPKILKRLKPGLEARLLRMAMQDHYVEVFTSNGSQLVLMRFADALEEVEGEPGWRVHRSHWVAEAAMRNIRRADGK